MRAEKSPLVSACSVLFNKKTGPFWGFLYLKLIPQTRPKFVRHLPLRAHGRCFPGSINVLLMASEERELIGPSFMGNLTFVASLTNFPSSLFINSMVCWAARHLPCPGKVPATPTLASRPWEVTCVSQTPCSPSSRVKGSSFPLKPPLTWLQVCEKKAHLSLIGVGDTQRGTRSPQENPAHPPLPLTGLDSHRFGAKDNADKNCFINSQVPLQWPLPSLF